MVPIISCVALLDNERTTVSSTLGAPQCSSQCPPRTLHFQTPVQPHPVCTSHPTPHDLLTWRPPQYAPGAPSPLPRPPPLPRVGHTTISCTARMCSAKQKRPDRAPQRNTSPTSGVSLHVEHTRVVRARHARQPRCAKWSDVLRPDGVLRLLDVGVRYVPTPYAGLEAAWPGPSGSALTRVPTALRVLSIISDASCS